MWLLCPALSFNKCFLFLGAMNPLAEEHLSKQDLLFLDMLKFLCIGVTTAQNSPVSFRAVDIRRKLLMLIDPSILDLTKSLHLHMVSKVKWFFSGLSGIDAEYNRLTSKSHSTFKVLKLLSWEMNLRLVIKYTFSFKVLSFT